MEGEENSMEESPKTPTLSKKNIILAALYLANKPLPLDELSKTIKTSVEDAEGHVAELSEDLKSLGFPLKITLFDDPAKLSGSQVKLEIVDDYLAAVSHHSSQIEFSKKAQKILALIAKKKELLQSELKYYFKGDIYEAVDELIKQKLLIEEKYKNTKKLKPTKLFFERYKLVE